MILICSLRQSVSQGLRLLRLLRKRVCLFIFILVQISLGSNLTFYLLDVVIDMGGYNIDEVLFDPLGVFLTRCKSAKTLSK